MCQNNQLLGLDVSNNPKVSYSSLVQYSSPQEREMTVPPGDEGFELSGIDTTRISNLKGAQLNGNKLTGYHQDTPITYSYAIVATGGVVENGGNAENKGGSRRTGGSM